MNGDLVSVIVPAKNAQRTIALCVESILRQTYQPVEAIVVDNDSTDNTAALARLHGATVVATGGPRQAARNVGARLARGKYLLNIDSDMELHPEAVDQCVRLAARGADLVVLPERNVARGFWVRAYSFGNKELGRGLQWYESGRFMSKEWFWRIGGYDEVTVRTGEDRDIHYRMVAQGARVASTKAITLHHVEHLAAMDLFRKSGEYVKNRELFLKKYSHIEREDRLQFLNLFRARWRLMVNHPLLTMGWLMWTTLLFTRNSILLFSLRNGWFGQTCAAKADGRGVVK